MVGGVAAALAHGLLRALGGVPGRLQSISVFSSAPTSTTKAEMYSQNIKMMTPARAP